MFGKEEYREINANLNRQLEEKQVLIAVHRGTWGGNVAQNTIQAYRISREMARREMDGRRALLEKRSRIAEKVVAQAADILRKETESDRYSALLTRYAKAAHDAFARRSEDAGLPFPEDVVFLLNKKDQAFQETIRKAYGAPCVFREDSSISIGGFCAESPSLRLEIDSTLDSMLENQRDWFEEASQLSVG